MRTDERSAHFYFPVERKKTDKEKIMDLGLTGKGVIITGASKGIGRAIALEFATEGANVAICRFCEAALP